MAEETASMAISNTTQISAAAHAAALALLKLNRLIPKAFLSLFGRYSRWRASAQKQPIELCISRTKGYIEMNKELLSSSDNQQDVELPPALVNRMLNQRRESSQRQSLPITLGGMLAQRIRGDSPQPGRDQAAGQDQTGGESMGLKVTKLELQILNKEHEIHLDELNGRIQAINRQQYRFRKTYVVPTEIFFLVVGLVFWLSLVIGLILGLGDFTRPESFVTAFTIITSVATSEFDYFRRIVLARRKSSEVLDTDEGQHAQEPQTHAEEGGSEQGGDASKATNSKTYSIQDEMEMLV